MTPPMKKQLALAHILHHEVLEHTAKYHVCIYIYICAYCLLHVYCGAVVMLMCSLKFAFGVLRCFVGTGAPTSQDTGCEDPFFDGPKHRFKDVQSLPEAQLRESQTLSYCIFRLFAYAVATLST